MLSEFQGRFDCADILDFSKADTKIEKNEHLGLENDELVVLSWEINYGAVNECIDWLYQNRITASDFDTPFRHFDEVYRTVSITAEPTRNSNSAILRHTMAKGWYTSIPSDYTQWVQARIFSSEQAAGNSVSAAGIGSASNESWFTIEFPYCDPDRIDAMVASLPYGILATPITVRNQTIGAGMSVIAVTHEVAEDKSRTIKMIIARPEYVLKAFSDLFSDRETENFYVWNVPKALAQDAIDAWKASAGNGASATASYNESQKLVDIILSRRVPDNPPNLSTGEINKTCDSTVQYHFAWGYTKAQIGTFIQNHNGTPTGASYGMAGVTRSISVNARGDGFYDATIVEEIVTYDESKHKISEKIFIGENGSYQYAYYGWNVPKSQLTEMQALAADKTAGQNKQFQITRLDNCLFNYVLLIDFSAWISKDFTITNADEGANSVVTYEWACDNAKIELIKAALVAAKSDLVETSIQVQKNNDDTFDCIYTVKNNITKVIYFDSDEDEESENFGEPSSGPINVNLALYAPNYVWGYNCKVLPTEPDGWSFVDPAINILDNGRFHYSIKIVKNDSKLDTGSVVGGGNSHNRRQRLQTVVAYDVATLPVTGDYVNGIDQDVDIRINPQTGRIIYEHRKTSWVLPSGWQKGLIVADESSYRRRKKVLLTSLAFNKVLTLKERQKISKQTTRTFYLERPESPAGEPGEDYIASVTQVDDNLWYTDLTIVVIGQWEDDGGLEWVEIPAI